MTLTIEQILQDETFKNNVREVLKKVIESRENRKEKPGFRYKKDWYDGMPNTSTKYFLDNIKSIWEKKSDLPAIHRNIILYVCGIALTKTFMEEVQ